VAVGSGGGVVALVLRLCTAPGAETSSDQRATRLEHDVGNVGRGGGASAEALYGLEQRRIGEQRALEHDVVLVCC
jgi:hypothetical protein